MINKKLINTIYIFFFLVLLACTGNDQKIWNFITSDTYENAQQKEEQLNENFKYCLTSQRPINSEIGILKWHKGFYNSPTEVISMLDAVMKELDEFNVINTKEKLTVHELSQFFYKNTYHTQTLGIFKKYPGKDPWGSISNNPIYKHLLPSEMKGLEIYTSKMTGKCTSLTFMIYCIVKKSLEIHDVDKNLILIRRKGHTFGMFKLDTIIYVIDNNIISPISKERLDKLNEGFNFFLFNDSIYLTGHFTIPFDTESTLLDAIMDANELEEVQMTRHELNIDSWYQSSVNINFIDYITASMESPYVKYLSGEFRSFDELLKWTQKNIKYNSIFSNYNERIMNADQVIIFKCGSSRDKGVFLCSVLGLMGLRYQLYLYKNATFLTINGKVINLKNLTYQNQIPINWLAKCQNNIHNKEISVEVNSY